MKLGQDEQNDMADRSPQSTELSRLTVPFPQYEYVK